MTSLQFKGEDPPEGGLALVLIFLFRFCIKTKMKEELQGTSYKRQV